ncbi:esterase-like activity of phytase family protein [Pontiellaceae bacterium B1224]|nr:esterase-like activity of phytase family protein [Pontiellaceae bacterium B1224]
MKKVTLATVGLIAATGSFAGQQHHKNNYKFQKDHYNHKSDTLFQHIATFDVQAGNASGVAEIVDVTKDGKTLVYTDAITQSIGFVDIRNPAVPTGLGKLDVGGEPTSLVVRGPHVLVAVNTSESYTEPSGKLVVVELATRNIVAEHDLGGQPDSISLAPNAKRAAVVIENERDEDLNGGLIPQNLTGTLLIAELWGAPADWNLFEADLSPVAENAYAGSDLEPEFVDINEQNEAVVTFQENNHIAIVNIINGQTINEFPAGMVELNNVDSEEEDLINFNTTLVKRAEPDAVVWLDNDSFATANEGDYEDENGEAGGSRGFTIFNQDGTVEFESSESFEHWLASAGHYSEARSENKGCEPEGIEYGKYGKNEYMFVGAERSNIVGVYDVSKKSPKEVQLLPTGVKPEGLKAIPSRDLLVVSTEEVALGEGGEDANGNPPQINIYRLAKGPAFYPMIESVNDDNGTPIPWVALSGLAADNRNPNKLYAVSDSFLAEGFIYTIKANTHPAQIVERTQVTGASESLDLEGIAMGPDGKFWLASEGNADGRPNMVLKVDTDGTVLDEITLPTFLEDNARGNGFEGIAVTGRPEKEIVYVAIQRAWPATGDTDKLHTKLGRYDVATGEWGFVYYPLEAEGEGGWIGLSEITHIAKDRFAIIERDKGWGPTTAPNAELKAIYGVNFCNVDFRAYDDEDGLVTVDKKLLGNVLPILEASSTWTAEKLEGLAITKNGKVYIVSDNDGVDEAPGETVFLRIR